MAYGHQCTAQAGSGKINALPYGYEKAAANGSLFGQCGMQGIIFVAGIGTKHAEYENWKIDSLCRSRCYCRVAG